MNKERRNEQGFTMIELIVVVAIMGIIGALLVPAFGKMSAKAKLTTDVTAVKTLQRQIDVYETEQTSTLPDYNAGADLQPTTVGELVKKGYLDKKDLKEVGTDKYEIQLQTGGKVVVEAAGDALVLRLDLTGITNTQVTDYIKKEVKSTDPMAGWITGADFSDTTPAPAPAPTT